MEHIEAVPEYPSTTKDGFAYIVNVTGIRKEDVDHLMQDVSQTISNRFTTY
jgi:hypothetical protein